jgi:hypothetical protein
LVITWEVAKEVVSAGGAAAVGFVEVGCIGVHVEDHVRRIVSDDGSGVRGEIVK